jgi:Ser/Thr protein kinase RdoA (MazF antagonist)
MAKLDGFRDEDLHPEILEALKRLEIAKDAYANACASIDGQYLVSLSDPQSAKQAEAVRALF